jgi:NADH:ubiquinone oxidoreductase subunit F (NADH-binding)
VFSSIGRRKSKGTKVFALAGKVNNVGLVEVPHGYYLRCEVIFEVGGGYQGAERSSKRFRLEGTSVAAS